MNPIFVPDPNPHGTPGNARDWKSAMRWFVRLCCFASALPALHWVSGCATTPPKGPPQPYLRVAYPDNHTVQLQIASRKFVPARGRGPAIWLVGASHIGESNYYAGLQRQLDAQTLVLYEGVGEHRRRKRVLKPGAMGATNEEATAQSPPMQAGRSPEADTGLQGTMAKSLGLVFQLDVINYEKTNFFNSDLGILEIQALMESGGKSSGKPAKPSGTRVRKAVATTDDENNTFRELLKAMDGSSAFGVVMQGLMNFIGTSTKLQAMAKLTLIEVLGAIRADPTRLQGVPPDMKRLLEVLIRERNKVVVEDLKLEVKRVRKGDTIGVFYGAGHLPDLEVRLRREMRYVPAEDKWHAAFSVDTARAGLSDFELNFLRSFIRSQIGPMTSE